MLIKRDKRDFFKIWFLDVFMADHKGYIAGGCFKNIFSGEKIKDVDIFFESETDFFEADRHFATSDDFTSHYETDNVKAYKHNATGIVAELCRKVFGKPEVMLSNFDFTITKFAYFKEEVPDEVEGETKIEYAILMDDMFFEHLSLKRIVADDKILFPMSTYERMIRYVSYGYMPCRETKLKIAQSINDISGELEINSRQLYNGMD